MINEIDILHERHCCDFACLACEKTAGLFRIVSYHHKIVIELGEYRFDSFTESFICLCRRTPVFLIQPIWNFKSVFCLFKEILLNISTEIAPISKHHAIMIFPAYIFEIMQIMDTRSSHIIRMYDTAYTTDSMEFIAVIVHSLRGTVAPVGSRIETVTSHGTAFRPCVLTYLYQLGIKTEYIPGANNGNSYILVNFLSKAGCQFTPGIELPSTDKIWELLLAYMLQTKKKEIHAIEAESLSCYAKSNDFEVGGIGNNTTSGYVSMFIDTISSKFLADAENSYEICHKAEHMQCDSTY